MGKALIEKKKNYHHGDLRMQLLEAVRGLVEQRGADGFSIAEACRLAGVSTAAPYKHFADRDDILKGVALLAMERLIERMEAAAASYPAGDAGRVVALGQSYVDFARDEPGVFRAMFALTEAHKNAPELEAAGDRALGIVIGVVSDHLGTRPDDIESITRAYALWCFVHGHAFLTLDGKMEHMRLPVGEDRLLDLIGSSILPPRGAASG